MSLGSKIALWHLVFSAFVLLLNPPVAFPTGEPGLAIFLLIAVLFPYAWLILGAVSLIPQSPPTTLPDPFPELTARHYLILFASMAVNSYCVGYTISAIVRYRRRRKNNAGQPPCSIPSQTETDVGLPSTPER
jgi:hypothetical protein